MLPNLGGPEMLFLFLMAVLLFGKRLPEVGRSLGKGIVEFKKGIQGIEDEIDRAATAPPRQGYFENAPSSSASSSASRDADIAPNPAVPKFEAPAPASKSASTPPAVTRYND